MENVLFKTETILVPNWDLVVTGTKFKGSIEGRECEGRILKGDGTIFYLCQNKKDGSQGDSTLGYEYSWEVDTRGSFKDLDIYITELELDPDFTYVEPEKPFSIPVGGYSCTIHEGYITVGCTNVSNELVRTIASKLVDSVSTEKK